jgi:creatinine amidohydrolase
MPKDSVLLADLTLPEVEAHIQDSPKVIVPTGATEQHGPHAPFCTDTLLAKEVSKRIAPQIGALVAPAVPYGLSGDHHGFAGVPYLSVETLRGLIIDLSVSLAEGGFREIIFINGHYTNIIGIPSAIADAGNQVPDGTIVYSFNYWDPLPTEEAEAYLGVDVGLHANIGETSAVMAVDESLVDLGRAVAEFPDFPSTPTPPLVAAFFFSGRGTTYRATRSGVWGDPRQSTRERGQSYLEQLESAAVRFVRDVEETFRKYESRG